MTFLWRPASQNFGNQHQILTYVFPNDYCYPAGFSASQNYGADDWFETDETLTTFNAREKLTSLINHIQMEAMKRKGNHILIPMGCDFAYQNAKEDFEAHNQMINYINLHNTANVKL